ncbi:MAG: Branched-chain amino acid transport system substrate-binding protein/urea transport system, partial [Tardiphaga sp.]|nr:Branched-chain amino acid transport system substrate-binding protein/urea transport system [Tardiphaga sp.]
MKLRSIKCMTFALLVCCAGLGASTGADAAEPIRIGAVLSFSGGVELYGQQAKLGLDLAVKDINAAGGILGRPVEVIYADDKTRPASAATAMQSLIESGVLAVVGPITSQNFNAVTPVAESLKTPLLYATNYEGGKCSRYVFSFSTVPNQELGQLLPYMNQTFGNTYFLLGADRVWPHQMFGIAQPLIEKLGGKVVGTQYTLGTEKDFTPLIAQVSASKAKVLLFALKGDGMDFIRQADDRGLLKDTTVAFLGLSEVDLGVF